MAYPTLLRCSRVQEEEGACCCFRLPLYSPVPVQHFRPSIALSPSVSTALDVSLPCSSPHVSISSGRPRGRSPPRLQGELRGRRWSPGLEARNQHRTSGTKAAKQNRCRQAQHSPDWEPVLSLLFSDCQAQHPTKEDTAMAIQFAQQN